MANFNLHFAQTMFCWSSLEDSDVLGVIINRPPDSDSDSQLVIILILQFVSNYLLLVEVSFGQ
jgi:hypothetical protein